MNIHSQPSLSVPDRDIESAYGAGRNLEHPHTEKPTVITELALFSRNGSEPCYKSIVFFPVRVLQVASEEKYPMLRPDVLRKFYFFYFAYIASFPMSLSTPAATDVTFESFERIVIGHRRRQSW